MRVVELFGLQVDASGALKVIRDVTQAGVTMAKDGATSARQWGTSFGEWTGKVARTYIPETTRAIERLRDIERQRQSTFAAVAGQDQTVQYMRGLAQASTEAGRAMAKLELQAREMDAALTRGSSGITTLTNAGGKAGTGINSLRSSVTSFTASLLNTAPGVAQFSGMLGSMALGSGVMIGVMAGMAAISLAYEHFAERAKEAQKQAEETRKEFEKIAHMSVAEQGAAASQLYSGDPNATKPIEQYSLKQLEQLRDGYAQAAKATETFTGAFGIQTKSLTKDAREAAANLKAFNAELTRRRDLLASTTGPGGSLTRAGTAKAAEDQAGFTTDKLKAEADATKALERSKKELEAQERRNIEAGLAGIAQVNGHIAQLKVEIDADQRMAAAKFKGQDAVDAMTVALAGEAAARDAAGKAMPARIQELKDLAEQHARNAIAARKTGEAEKQLSDDIQKAAAAVVDRIKKDADAAAAQQKYLDDMRDIWRASAGRIAADFVKSISRGFEEVYNLAVQLMKRMEQANKASGFAYGALKVGAAAIGGGLAGYAVGQATGNRATGALGGAAAGALAGSAYGPIGTAVGAVAGFVGGIIGAGNAAKEAAQHMAELQKALAANIATIRSEISGDTLGGTIAQEKARFDALRKQTEDAYSGGSSSSEQVRKRNAVLAELNGLEAQRIQQLKDEAALTLKQLNEDVQAQIVRNNGDAAAADAMEKALEQERRFIELRKAGIDDATLEQLRQSEAKRDADAAAKEAADALTEAANAAAAAAQQAADKARAQQQAVEDINVELLNAHGQTGAAADLEFQLAQDRRLTAAKQGQTDEYVAKLLELQQLQRDQRAAQGLIDDTRGPAMASRLAANAMTAVSGGTTDRTALMLVDLTRAQNTTLDRIEINTRNGGVGGGGMTIHLHIEKPESLDDLMERIREELAPLMNEDLATTSLQTTLRSGSVRR